MLRVHFVSIGSSVGANWVQMGFNVMLSTSQCVVISVSIDFTCPHQFRNKPPLRKISTRGRCSIRIGDGETSLCIGGEGVTLCSSFQLFSSNYPCWMEGLVG